MRFSPLALVLGLAASTLSAPGASRPADDKIDQRSAELQRQGQTALAAGQLDAADSALEASLVVDPRNRGAYVDLARVAIRQQLYGQAIRMTRKALGLEPNDLDALAVQGEAMVALGAVERAKANLAKLETICAKGCPQVAQLSAAISRGPAMASAKPVETPKKN